MLNSLRHWGPPRPDDGLWNGNEEKHPWIIRLCEQVKCPPCYLSVIQQEQTRRWGGRIGTRFNSFWRANDVMNRRESGIIPSSSFFFFFSCCGLRVPWKWKCMYFFFFGSYFLLGNSNDEQVWSRDQKKFLISFLYLILVSYFFCRNRKCNKLLKRCSKFSPLYSTPYNEKGIEPTVPSGLFSCARTFRLGFLHVSTIILPLLFPPRKKKKKKKRFLYTDKFVVYVT